MKTLKSMIRRYMCLIAAIIVIGVLIMTFIADVLGEQRHEKQLAQRMFYQIERVLEDNEKLRFLKNSIKMPLILNEEQLSKKILAKEILPGQSILVDTNGEEITFKKV